MRRGEIWDAELPDPLGSSPAYRRPVVIVQADEFTRTRLRTAVIVVLTKTLRLASLPGNILLRASESGLDYDCVLNVTQIFTVDKALLVEKRGEVDDALMVQVSAGMKRVLDLW